MIKSKFSLKKHVQNLKINNYKLFLQLLKSESKVLFEFQYKNVSNFDFTTLFDK